ncbi:MAG: DUF3365 domain-containing protein [Hyphomonas sp.]|uniref:Tll0287-like domain-containing protein n=1 Tax=Hyphomonas sp. TaxID=87 RepID=UPI003527657E
MAYRTAPAFRLLLAATALGGLAACGPATEAPAPAATPAAPDAAEVDGARYAAGLLGSRLKGRLMAAMQEGGPEAAVAVCAEEAPVIAAEVSAETGYTVGRTALRVRNPANAPDAWEETQLHAFIDALADGADPATLEVAELVDDNGTATLRWARPILLDAPCATCHGQEVDPALLANIHERYPEDTATGFAIGDVRGMFTVSK